jgi:hypothetical protein
MIAEFEGSAKSQAEGSTPEMPKPSYILTLEL